MQTRNLVSFDWAMKRLLRNKANFAVLEGFLSELLKRQIIIKQILESESNQDSIEDKFNKVDVLAEDAKKELMIIEVQYNNQLDYFLRMLYGTSKVISERITKSSGYGMIRKVYSINIVYFDLGQGNDYVYHGKTHFKGIHTNETLRLSEKQREKFGYIEAGDLHPEYYIIKVNQFNNVAKDTLDEWIYFLKNNEIKAGFKAQGLDVACEVMDYDKLSLKEKHAYERARDAKWVEDDIVSTAEDRGLQQGLKKGLKQGLEKGLERGLKKGMQQGMQQGMQRTQIEIAQRMLSKNEPMEKIMQYTGLSSEQIESLH
jgi:predicted transposase/invertase (TIGR01784 family)